MNFSEFAEDLPEGFDDRYRKTVMDLEERAQKLGLYLQGATVTPTPETAHEKPPSKLLVMATFLLGDLAFSERVQHPEDYQQFDAPFREIRDDVQEDQLRDAEEQFRRGELGWKPKED